MRIMGFALYATSLFLLATDAADTQRKIIEKKNSRVSKDTHTHTEYNSVDIFMRTPQRCSHVQDFFGWLVNVFHLPIYTDAC